jgi:hypothetical protein
MHRMDRQTLEIELSVQLRTALRVHRARLGSKFPGMSDDAINDVVASVVGIIDSESSCVVRAEMFMPAGGFGRRAKFGKDEPWPAQLQLDMQAARTENPDGD